MPYKDPEQRRRYHREYMRTYGPEYRAEHPEAARSYDRVARHNQDAKGAYGHRFIGIDGEGYTDDSGQHQYMLLVASEDGPKGERWGASLYTGRPLTTEDILTWLVSLGRNATPRDVYVGFFFDYDVTMILRDILRDDPDVMQELVKPLDERERGWTRWGRFDLMYTPRKHLKVKRYGANRGKALTIHDTRTFFQTSFVKALRTFNVGDPDQVAEIERMKGERSRFRFPDDVIEIHRYCEEECVLLARLVGVLRDRFVGAKLSPWPYEGPGPVAGTVLKARGMRHSEEHIPATVHDLARQAYYGGRFETLAHGTLGVPIYEYDIKSAYPAAMLRLPCLVHGEWIEHDVSGLYHPTPEDVSEFFTGPMYRSDTVKPYPLWVGPVEWDCLGSAGAEEPGAAGPLPWRFPDGAINFPLRGRGVYWSVELPPYARPIGPAWVYVNQCDCRPFKWVEDMYVRRRRMEAEAKGSGLPLKLVLNSLYGKLAQRIGKRPFYNPVWAGLITAMTRRMVYDVYRNHPVVMFATDAVFTTEPAPELTIGEGLGQWEEVGPYRDLTIFQPGVYFDEDAAKFKTRGVPYGEFRSRAPEFIAAANDLSVSVRLDMENHLGIRQALAWGPTRYRDLGNWLPAPRTFKAHPGRKRRLGDDGELYSMGGIDRWSLAPVGTLDVPSTPYDWKSREEVGADTLIWEEGLPDGTVLDGPSGGETT